MKTIILIAFNCMLLLMSCDNKMTKESEPSDGKYEPDGASQTGAVIDTNIKQGTDTTIRPTTDSVPGKSRK